MWLLLAFLSAALLGFYDVFKKKSLRDNAVLPVLFLNTLFSSLIFLPFILVSAFAPSVLGGTMFDVPVVGWEVHKFIVVKSFIVLSSWIFGYFGMKHLPLSIWDLISEIGRLSSRPSSQVRKSLPKVSLPPSGTIYFP